MKYKNIVSLIDKYQKQLTKLQETGMNYNRQLILGDRIEALKEQWNIESSPIINAPGESK